MIKKNELINEIELWIIIYDIFNIVIYEGKVNFNIMYVIWYLKNFNIY